MTTIASNTIQGLLVLSRPSEDGSLFRLVDVASDHDDATTHLSSMRSLMGVDLVDVIGLPKNLDCWVDDEGLINGSDSNLLASCIVGALRDDPNMPDVRGNALFLAHDSKTGSAASLTIDHKLDLIAVTSAFVQAVGALGL